MREHETEKFQKYGSFFFLLLFGIGFGLPLLASLILCLVQQALRVNTFFPLLLVFMIIAWVSLAMLIGWGNFTTLFVKRTAKSVGQLPYHFDSTYSTRSGMLFIDVEGGMIGLISAYNPMQIQVFSASRVDKMQTVASATSGVRFFFYLDGKKITMPTLLTNRVVSLKSGIGAEAVSKADTYVSLLWTAKRQAEGSVR